MVTRAHDPFMCPHCFAVMRASTAITEVDDPPPAPVEGCASFCELCGGIAYFEADGPRRATDAEVREVLRQTPWLEGIRFQIQTGRAMAPRLHKKPGKPRAT